MIRVHRPKAREMPKGYEGPPWNLELQYPPISIKVGGRYVTHGLGIVDIVYKTPYKDEYIGIYTHNCPSMDNPVFLYSKSGRRFHSNTVSGTTLVAEYTDPNKDEEYEEMLL